MFIEREREKEGGREKGKEGGERERKEGRGGGRKEGRGKGAALASSLSSLPFSLLRSLHELY